MGDRLVSAGRRFGVALLLGLLSLWLWALATSLAA